jgi:ABC-2 type transport system permease protein
MPSRAIKPKRDRGNQETTWQSIEERAPSIVRAQGPSFPRYVAVVSLVLITVGGASLLFNAGGRPYLIPPGWGFFMLATGVAGLLFHAYSEKEIQFRRLYGALGAILIVVAAFLRLYTAGEGSGSVFLPYGALSLLLTLGFLLSFVKNESEVQLRTLALNCLGLLAVINILIGFIGGMVSEAFLLHTGILHLILGLLFAAAYVGMEGSSSSRGYWAGYGIGVVGAAMFLVAVVRALLPWIYVQFNLSGRPPSSFLLPSGLILMCLGACYLGVSLGICSDKKLAVLTRREIGEFFFSPIAYIVMIGMAVLGWSIFVIFMFQVWDTSDRSPMGGGGQMPEPIVANYLISFLVLIPLIFLAPIITMRMLSEEKRAGTLEVLLTAPVNEWQVVLAKFLAGLCVFALCWALWGVFFIALRVEGDRAFDYRPLIVFFIALICMGANFVAMGLFVSSLTRHQILAAVFTFVGMMVLTLLFILGRFVDIGWVTAVIGYLSYIDLWIESANGKIMPRLLVFQLTVAVFWLYLTIKVLESRKWS